MPYYWISFRLADGPDYDRRYQPLTEAIEELAQGGYWPETSSFYLVDTPLRIDDLGSRLARHLDARRDILLVRRLDNQSAVYFGALEYEDTLKAFMPYAERLR